MIPNSLIMVGVAPLSGWISDRLSARLLSSAGLGLVCVALLGLSRLGANSVYSDVLLMLLLLGLGQGLFQSPNTSSIFGSVPRERYGTASGFISMMRNLGSVTGVALASNLLMAGLASTVGHVNISALAKAGVAESGPVLAGFISGMERAYLLAAALAAFGVLASLSRGGTFGRERVVAPQAQSQAIAPAARSTTSPAHRLSSTDGSAGPDTTDG